MLLFLLHIDIEFTRVLVHLVQFFCDFVSTLFISFYIKSLAFRGSILWNSMPDTIKSVENVFRFKKGIKAWNGDKCSSNICK